MAVFSLISALQLTFWDYTNLCNYRFIFIYCICTSVLLANYAVMKLIACVVQQNV